MLRHLLLAICVGLGSTLTGFAADAYTVKEGKAAPPEGLKEAIAKVLGENSIQVSDAKGNLLAEIWFRKEVTAKATPEQIKNGLSYREVPEGTLMGVVRFPKNVTDYKKQTIKRGVYTLRLGVQPENGDHQGTAPYPDFCLLVPADDDKDPAPIIAKELQDRSDKASGSSHPAVFLLFPIPLKEVGDQAKMVDKGDGHWVLTSKVEVKVGDEKTDLGVGLTLIGVSSAAQ
jgi:hypothetical protein